MVKRVRGILLVALALLVTTGCEPQARGFALPPGDSSKGLEAFRELQCNQCHSIPNIIKKRFDSLYPEVEVVLGGPVQRIKTYGQLVTAIIHPGKAVTRAVPESGMVDEDTSIMPVYNGAMTVEQLVNLATFLQETYELTPPPYYPMVMH